MKGAPTTRDTGRPSAAGAAPARCLLRNALVATCDRGPGDAGVIARGAVAISDGVVSWVGPDRELEAAVETEGAEVVDCGGRLVTPGLVDSHTHLVFAGDRASEVALRSSGRSYAEIARRGGGIASTVRATRGATDEELLGQALVRARRLLGAGVTTVEVKSGYGLSVAEELRLLRVVRELGRRLEPLVSVVPTLLAAHAVPPGGSRREWLDAVVEELLPAVAEERLARFQDAFVDEGAFTAEEARRVLEAGARRGLVPRVHADQLTPSGGARLAAQLGCASADHLEHVDDAAIASLAASGVTAGLLPTSTLFLGMTRFAPARRLLDAGVTVALATNVNPGSAPSESPSLTLGLASAQLGMSPGEALVAFTAGGARALRLTGVGCLTRGAAADLVVWGCRTVEHLCWHLGVDHALRVMKNGRFVHEALQGAAADCP